MSRRSYKFRIYPNSGQLKKLEHTLYVCADIYNQLLEIKEKSWKDSQKNLSKFDCNKLISKWRVADAHSQVLQNVSDRVDKAFKNFFRRVKNGEKPGYPRFKFSIEY